MSPRFFLFRSIVFFFLLCTHKPHSFLRSSGGGSPCSILEYHIDKKFCGKKLFGKNNWFVSHSKKFWFYYSEVNDDGGVCVDAPKPNIQDYLYL